MDFYASCARRIRVALELLGFACPWPLPSWTVDEKGIIQLGTQLIEQLAGGHLVSMLASSALHSLEAVGPAEDEVQIDRPLEIGPEVDRSVCEHGFDQLGQAVAQFV